MSNNYKDLISNFRELSEEEKNKFLKELILGEIFKDNIKVASESYITPWFLSSKFEERKQNYLDNFEKDSSEAVDHLIDIFDSEDTVLKYNLFRTFVSYFDYNVEKTKKEICGKCHDFPDEWEETKGERPVVKNNCITEEKTYGKYLIRRCRYCNTVEKAYSKEHKEYLEKVYNESIKAKKLFYIRKEEFNKKNSQ